MSPISLAESASVVIAPLVDCASSAAMHTTELVCWIRVAISVIDFDNASAAHAADFTPVQALPDASTALSARCKAQLEVFESETAVDFIAAALSPNVFRS